MQTNRKMLLFILRIHLSVFTIHSLRSSRTQLLLYFIFFSAFVDFPNNIAAIINIFWLLLVLLLWCLLKMCTIYRLKKYSRVIYVGFLKKKIH